MRKVITVGIEKGQQQENFQDFWSGYREETQHDAQPPEEPEPPEPVDGRDPRKEFAYISEMTNNLLTKLEGFKLEIEDLIGFIRKNHWAPGVVTVTSQRLRSVAVYRPARKDSKLAGPYIEMTS